MGELGVERENRERGLCRDVDVHVELYKKFCDGKGRFWYIWDDQKEWE